MKNRQDLIRLCCIESHEQFMALIFFLFLAERLKNILPKGLRIQIASWNIDQIMFPGVILGGYGKRKYYRWCDNTNIGYIELTHLLETVEKIQQGLNPENLPTKELYRFESDDWHLLILTDYLQHILTNKEEFSQIYLTEVPKSNCIVAEIAGQFYVAARPEDSPLVAEGEEVEKGKDVGVIVVSKTNNYIGAPIDCKITKVLVENDTTVELGQPLFEIIPIFNEQE